MSNTMNNSFLIRSILLLPDHQALITEFLKSVDSGLRVFFGVPVVSKKFYQLVGGRKNEVGIHVSHFVSSPPSAVSNKTKFWNIFQEISLKMVDLPSICRSIAVTKRNSTRTGTEVISKWSSFSFSLLNKELFSAIITFPVRRFASSHSRTFIGTEKHTSVFQGLLHQRGWAINTLPANGTLDKAAFVLKSFGFSKILSVLTTKYPGTFFATSWQKLSGITIRCGIEHFVANRTTGIAFCRHFIFLWIKIWSELMGNHKRQKKQETICPVNTHYITQSQSC